MVGTYNQMFNQMSLMGVPDCKQNNDVRLAVGNLFDGFTIITVFSYHERKLLILPERLTDLDKLMSPLNLYI